MSGAMSAGGFPDKPPVRAFVPWVDYSTGVSAALGIVLALRHRDRTGEGQAVDLALLQTATSVMTPVIAEADVLGQVRPLTGNRVPYYAPTDLYRCKDGWVFIATITDALWKRLVKTIGHEELLSDPDLYNDYQRYLHRDRVDPLVAEWIAERTVDEVESAMERARIPCGRYLRAEEVSSDPHVRERSMIAHSDLEAPGLDRVPICGIPFDLSRTPGRVVRRAPRVGEHNGEVYGDLLGIDEERLAGLVANGIV
jgi:crotonobetainyl-CoA:carnitine CoA-transferase CaiB-like acyl-CoA transferase